MGSFFGLGPCRAAVGASGVLLVPFLASGCGGLSADCRQEAERVSAMVMQQLQAGSDYANALTNSLSDGDGFSESENARLDQMAAESDRLDAENEAAKTALIARCGPDVEQEYLLP